MLGISYSTNFAHGTAIVSPALMKTLVSELKEMVEEEEERRGLAVVVGNDAEDLPGVKKDMETMKKAFREQDLAVWKMVDAHSAEIAGAVQAIANHTFPPQYEILIFYFCGLVGSDDEYSYIKTAECDGVDTLSVEKGIISPLRDSPLQRMFLFDCCLENNAKRPKHLTRYPKRRVPSPPTCDAHVAYSTSATSCDRVDGDGGGVWARFLAKFFKLGRAFDQFLHLSSRETVQYLKQSHEKELKDGKMTLHGPSSANGEEEVDFPGSNHTHRLVCHGHEGKPMHPLLACIFYYPRPLSLLSDLCRPL